jgi:hypothetical protein
MIKISQENIEDLERILGFPLGEFLLDYRQFYQSSFPRLVNFFSGKIEEIDSSHFASLSDLGERSVDLSSAITQKSHLMDNVKYWEWVDYLSDLRVELLVSNSIDKFLRSNVINPTYTNEFAFDYTLKAETLEDVSNVQLGRGDYNNHWTEIAMRNDLEEIEYDGDGGNSLNLFVRLNFGTFTINSVVDNIQGESVFGKDLDKTLTFEDDDLLALSPRRTIKQTVEILTGLEKGDVPEFKDFGRSGGVGSNVHVFALSSLIRQMAEIFATDDTLTGFKVKNFQFNAADVVLSFEVSTRLDLIVRSSLKIN